MITIVFEVPGMTAAQYDQINQIANIHESNLPAGLIFHQACPTETGWLVTDVWESMEAFQAFGERLLPALQTVGVEGRPRIFETYNVWR